MNRDILLLLVGASLGLISSFLTIAVQHLLTLREDRVKRHRDRLIREKEDLRISLKRGIGELELIDLQQHLMNSNKMHRFNAPLDDTKDTLRQLSLDRKFEEVEKLILDGKFEESECKLDELKKEQERILELLQGKAKSDAEY